jgi:GDP-L-fucose synthase
MADASVLLMSLPEVEFDRLLKDWSPPLVNIGCGVDLTIRELAQTVSAIVGFQGQLHFDTSKPDGTPRKILDVSRITALGWSPAVPLTRGIELAYRDYLDRIAHDTSPHTAEVTQQGAA